MNLKQFCKIKKKIKNGVFEGRKVNRKLFYILLVPESK